VEILHLWISTERLCWPCRDFPVVGSHLCAVTWVQRRPRVLEAKLGILGEIPALLSKQQWPLRWRSCTWDSKQDRAEHPRSSKTSSLVLVPALVGWEMPRIGAGASSVGVRGVAGACGGCTHLSCRRLPRLCFYCARRFMVYLIYLSGVCVRLWFIRWRHKCGVPPVVRCAGSYGHVRGEDWDRRAPRPEHRLTPACGEDTRVPWGRGDPGVFAPRDEFSTRILRNPDRSPWPPWADPPGQAAPGTRASSSRLQMGALITSS